MSLNFRTVAAIHWCRR